MCVVPFDIFVISTTTISVMNRHRAIKIVIIPFGWLYNFLVTVIIPSVIIVSCFVVPFLSKFVQFSIIIILGINMAVIIIISIDKENISFEASVVT
jgi:hypothetical protein